MMLIHKGEMLTTEDISDVKFTATIRLNDGREILIDETDLNSLRALWDEKYPKPKEKGNVRPPGVNRFSRR